MAGDFEKQVSRFVSIRSQVEHNKRDIQILQQGKYPPGVRAFKSTASLAELDEKYSKAADA
eukprot:7006984-Pyramimonas_sp.AAC.1